jgi:hypothetical protein
MKNMIRVAFLSFCLWASKVEAAQERTWAFAINTVNGGGTTVVNIHNYHLWFTKSIMLGTGTSSITYTDQAGGGVTPSGGWTVSGSSPGDGTSNMSGTDTWTTTFDNTKFVHAVAASNHSWIALQSSHNTNYKMVIDCNRAVATPQLDDIIFGYGAFSGGTATARPTIATEFIGSNMASLQSDDASTVAHKEHGMLSTTGDFWVFSSKNGGAAFNSALGAVEMLNQPSWYTTYPLWTTAKYSATQPMWSGAANANPVFGAINAMSRAPRAATNVQIIIPVGVSGGFNNIFSTGVGGVNILSDPDPNGNTFQWPTHVMIWDSTAVKNDYAGRIPDFWIGSGLRVDGDVTPSAGTIDYMIVGDFWVPSNAAPTL